MRALITGITGQDGSYLAELLLEKKYEVFGLVRNHPNSNFTHIEHLRDRIQLMQADVQNAREVNDLVHAVRPDEIYHLAAKTFVPSSFEKPEHVTEFAVRSVTNLLEAISETNPACRFFHASSSEVFGNAVESPQSENTPLNPRSPYGEAKVLGQKLTTEARELQNLFAVSGILFNHESPRRGLNFVTRKITRTAAAIKLGKAQTLELGDLDARRDWGFAGEYVDAMWRMLQAQTPEDFVIATGTTHSVREFCELAFAELDLNYQVYVRVNPEFVRAHEAVQLVGNPAKAQRVLDWQARTPFAELVKMMVHADLVLSADPG